MDEPSTSKNVHQMVYCCNPFKKPGHDYHQKNLRSVNKNILRHNANIHKNDKICDGCRKAVLKSPGIFTEQELHSNSSVSQDDLDVRKDPGTNILSTPEKQEAIEALNKSLSAIQETPIRTKRLIEKKYPEAKIKKVTEAIRTKVLNLNPSTCLSLTKHITMTSKEKYDTDDIDLDIIDFTVPPTVIPEIKSTKTDRPTINCAMSCPTGGTKRKTRGASKAKERPAPPPLKRKKAREESGPSLEGDSSEEEDDDDQSSSSRTGEAIGNLHSMLESKLDQMITLLREIKQVQQTNTEQIRSLAETTVVTHTRMESLQQRATTSTLSTPSLYPSLDSAFPSAHTPVHGPVETDGIGGSTSRGTGKAVRLDV